MKDEHSAVGAGTSMPISRKQTREILNMIKGMKVDAALSRLDLVTDFKKPVPFKRYKIKMGHHPGMAAGRYPLKACTYIKKVLLNAKNNAVNKGLQEDKLFINNSILMMDISKNNQIRSRKGPYIKSVRALSVKINVKEKDEVKKAKKVESK